MIVLIDSMCNLYLLYYAAEPSSRTCLHEIATAHAHLIFRTHLREEDCHKIKECFQGLWCSTCHVTNVDPRTGTLKCRLSYQGFANESTWSLIS